jgi:ATP-binding cassette subfamily B protein
VLDRLLGQLRELATHSAWAFRWAHARHPSLIRRLAVVGFFRALLPAATALAIRGLINGVVAELDRESAELAPLLPWLCAALGITVGESLARFAERYWTGCLVDELELTLSSETLEHAARLDVEFFDSPASQDLIQRSRQDIAGHVTGFLLAILGLATIAIEIVSLVAILIVVEPLAVLILPLFALPHLGFQWRTARRYYETEHRRADKRRWSQYFASLLTDRRLVPEVKLLGLPPVLLRRFRELMAGFRDENRLRYRARLLGDSVFTVLSVSAAYALFGRVLHRVLNESLTVGDVAVFASVALRLRNALEHGIAQTTGALQKSLFISNLRTFLEVEPRVYGGATEWPSEPKGEIEFRDVSFTYPGTDRPVLRDVSFRVAPGETVALVGRNGAGKTTVAKLLARFYDVSEGEVLLDGWDLRSLSPELLHRKVGFVFQEFGRYEATAGENLAYGDWRRLLSDPGEVKRVAERTGVSELIEGLPEGYDTNLGRRFGHHDFSGGQWQQLAVARALARDVAMIVLDEPTSNLDAEAEYALFQRFREMSKGRTTFLISHRFATVSMADRIFVMDEGRLVEQGTHEELMALGGRYARMYELQQRQLREEGDTP